MRDLPVISETADAWFAARGWMWFIDRYAIGYVLAVIFLCAVWGYLYRPSRSGHYGREPWTNKEVVEYALLHGFLWPFELPISIMWGVSLLTAKGALYLWDQIIDKAAKALPETQRQPGFQLHSKLSLNGGSKREQLR